MVIVSLQMTLTLLESNDDYVAGSQIIDFGVQRDHYENQLIELAQMVNREMKNPYSYAHDFLVQEVVLATSGYIKYEAGGHE